MSPVSRRSRPRITLAGSARSPSGDASIPTDSMADIAFLLIVYFMLTMVFSATQGMDLPPTDDTPPQSLPQESIYVHVLPGGRLSVDGRPLAVEELLGYVVPRLRANAAKPVILRTDPAASYQEMVRAYDELRSAEERTGVRIRNIAIPTEREIREWIELLGRDPFGPAGS